MTLPNGQRALIPIPKISEYLLSESHIVGRVKARYFRRLGYRSENPDVLVTALALIAERDPVRESVETAHGTKYIVDGGLQTPSGAHARIRTIWIIESNQDAPRVVTAYPTD